MYLPYNSYTSKLLFISCISIFLFLGCKNAVSQAVPQNSSSIPRHVTLDQQTIGVLFNGGNLAGSSNVSQWSVSIDHDGAGPLSSEIALVTSLSTSENGTFSSSITFPVATIFTIAVKFDASSITGHSGSISHLLPGETITVTFNNIGNSLTTVGSGLAVANFGPLSSKNQYGPSATGVGDILYISEGIASVLDQCSPVNTNFFRWTYLYSQRFRNSSKWTTANNRLRVSWGSGGSTSDLNGFLSNSGGDPSTTQSPVNNFPGGTPGVYVSFRSGLNIASANAGIINVDGTNQFIYPDNTGVCNFRTTHYPIGITTVYDAVGNSDLQKNTQFNSYDYDDQNTGTLSLTPSTPPTTTTSDQVCLGSNVNVRFTDNSTFNCVGDGTNLLTPGQGAAATPINKQQRWVRIIYGGANSAVPASVIPNVEVGGVPVTDATGSLLPAWSSNPILPGTYSDNTPNGAPMSKGYVSTAGADANGVITLAANATVPSVLSELITTSSPTGQIVGQRFYVTLQYWGICNPYPTSAPVEISVDYVEIITKPVPLTATSKDYCFDQDMTSQNFTVSGAVGGMTAINWYNTNPTLGVATLLSTGTSLTYPASPIVPASVAGGGTYSVWATQVVGGTNACESDPVEVIIRKREQLTAPGTITNTTGTTFSVCAGTSGIGFTVPTAAGSTTIGGTVEYLWTITSGTSTINGAANGQTVVVDVPAGANGAQNLRVVKRYTTTDATGSKCTTTFSDFPFTVDAATVGGTVAGTTSICSGQNTGLITLSGNTGSIIRWEVNGVTDATLGTANPINPTLNASGTYVYQAFVKNGNCGAVGSTATATITVVDVPGKPSIGSAPGSIACEGDPITLNAGNVGAAIYNWFKEPAPWTPNNSSTALQVWLKADAGVTTAGTAVTQWNDQSGGGRNVTPGATANRPALSAGALNGLPVVDFDGVDDYLRNTALGNPVSLTVITLAKSDVAGQTDVLVDVSDNTTQTDRRYVQTLDASNYRSRTINNASTTFNASRSFTDIASYHIFYGDQLANTNTKGSVDGIPLFISATSGTLRNATNFQLGAGFNATTTRQFDGKIAEVIIYNGVITLADRQRVEGYLAHKWGLTGNLPSDHPYKNTPPLNTTVQSSASTQLLNLDVPAESGTYRVQAIGASSTSCVSEPSNSISIVINTRPTVVLSGGGSVCSGIPAPDVVFTFTGVGPYNLVYSIGGVVQPAVNGVTSPYSISTPAAGVYAVVSISDSNSPACTVTAPNANITGAATVNVSATAPPSVDSFTATAAVCDDGGTTNPPDAVLNLSPDQVETYSIGYKLKNLNTLAETVIAPANFTSDGSGIVTISPTYPQMGSASEPLGYQIIITSIFNTVTLCAGAVPINGPTLIVNPRPVIPTGGINSTACSSGTGSIMSVTDPGAGFDIQWSTAGPTVAAFSAVTVTNGVASGTRTISFTPATSGNLTFYAFTRNTTTGCLSATGIAVTQTQDLSPAAAAAGAAQPNVCGILSGSPTITLAATAATNGGNGTWTVPGKIAYFQNFENLAVGTTASTAYNGWTRNVAGANAFPQQGGSGYFEVRTGKRFEAQNTNGGLLTGAGNIGEVVWSSGVFDISAGSGFPAVSAFVDLTNVSGGLAGPEDYIKIFYKLDGGAETPFTTNGNNVGNFASGTASVSGLVGTNLQIVIRVSTDGVADIIAFDNVIVKDPASSISFANPNSTSTTVTNVPAPAPGGVAATTVFKWTVASALGACGTSSNNVSVTINPLPTSLVITPQLCDDITGAPFQAGGISLSSYSASVSNAIGLGGTVDWYSNTTDRTSEVSKIVTAITITNAATYYFKAKSPAPFNCAIDGSTTFTVNALPAAIDKSYEFCENSVSAFVATGINLTSFEADVTSGATSRDVEWYEDNGGGGLGVLISGALETSYGLTSGPLNTASSKTIHAKIIDTSSPVVPKCFDIADVVLKYKPRPANNGIIGANVVCTGNSGIVYQLDPSVNGYGTDHRYTWTITPGAGTPGPGTVDNSVLIGGGTNTINSFVFVKFPGPNVGGITISAFESIDGCSGNTDNFNITVASAPPALAFSVPATQVCKGQSQVYSLTTNNPLSVYTWTVVGGTIVGAQSGAGLSTITVNWGSVIVPQPKVSVTETSSSGCSGAPASIDITLNDVAQMNSLNSASICSNSTPASILPFTSTISGSTFSWKILTVTSNVTFSGAVIPTFPAGGSTGTGDLTHILTNTSGINGTIVYEVTPTETDLPSPPNCAGTPQTVTVTVKPEPVVAAVSNIVVCSGDPISAINFSANTAGGEVFNWTNSNATIGLATSGTGAISAYTAPNNFTGVDIVGTIVVKAIKNGCESAGANTKTFTITIRPQPDVTTVTNKAVCSGGLISAINFSANTGGGEIFNWTNSQPSIGLAASGTGDITAFTAAANTTGVDIVATITVTAVKGGCTSSGAQSKSFTIRVQPAPVVAAITNISVCPGQTIGPISFTANTGGGETFIWTNNNTSIGLLASGSGNISSFTAPMNTSGVDMVANISVAATASTTCVGSPTLFTITVKPEPVVSTISDVSVCSGDAISAITFSANTGGSEVFTWTNTNTSTGLAASGSGNIGGYTAPINISGGDISGVVTVTAAKNGCTSSAPNKKSFLVTVKPQPVVSAITNVSVCSGGAISAINFSANTGGGENFTWTNSNISIGLSATGSGDITAFTAPTNLTGLDIVATIVVTASKNGCTSVGANTKTFTITVKPQPVVAAITDISVCSGDPISGINFVANTGGSETFNWTNTNASIGQPLTGIGNIGAYTAPTNITGVDIVGDITVTATKNGCTSTGLNAKTFRITVKPQPVVAAITNISVCSGDVVPAVSFTANTGGSETFNWTNNNPAVGLAASGIGSTGAYTSPNNFTGSDISATLTVSASKNGCTSVGANTKIFTITIRPQPVVSTLTNISVCSGETISAINFSANTSGGEVFNWTNTNTAVGLALSGSGSISSYTAPDNFTGLNAVGTITVTATKNSCVSAGANIKSFTITVKPQPVIDPITNIVVCSGDLISGVSFLANTGGGETFNWTNTNTGIGLGAAGSGNISGYTAPNNFTGNDITGVITVNVSKNSCTSTGTNSKSFSITIRPQPVVAAITDISVCSGAAVPAIAFTANTAGGEVFNWNNSNTGVGLVASGSGNIAGYVAPINITGSPIVATITVTATKNTCTSTGSNSKTFTITIKPEPVVVAVSNIVVCSDQPISTINFSANTLGGEIFNWSNSNTAIGLSASGSGNIPSYSAPTNITNSPMLATITVTATKNGCISTGANSKTFTITVNPEPIAPAVTSVNRCSGAAINFDLQTLITNNSVTSKFKYTASVKPGDGNPLDLSPALFPGTFDRVTASVAQITDQFTNVSGGDIIITYEVTPISNTNNCDGTPFSFKVRYFSEPKGADFNDPVCSSGSALNHNLQTQITNGITSLFTYTVSSNNVGVTAGTARAVASSAPITDTYLNGTGTPAIITYTVTARSVANGCIAQTTFKYTVIVDSKPVAKAASILKNASIVCSDNTFTFDPQLDINTAPGNSVVSTFKWNLSYDGIPVSTNTSGIVTGNFHNESNATKNAVFTVTPTSSSGCVGDAFDIVVPINAEPVMNPSLVTPVPICSSNNTGAHVTNITFSTNGLSVAAANYNVVFDAAKSQVTGLTGTPTQGSSLSNIAIKNDSYRNTTAAQLKVVYRVTPVSVDGCLGDPFDITVLINPEPVVVSPINPDACSTNSGNSNPINIVLGTNGSSVNASTYAVLQIQYSNGGPFSTTLPTGFTRIPVPGAGINLIKNDKYTNISALPVTVRYSIQGTSSAGCLSEAVNYDIVINPEPTLIPGAISSCSGETVSPLLVLTAAPSTPAIATYELKQVLISDARVTAASANVPLGVYSAADFLKNDVFFNVGDVDLHVIYKIVPISAAGCKGAEQTVDLTVRPAPTLAAGLDAKVCSGSQTNIVLKDNSSGNPTAVIPFSAAAGSYQIVSIVFNAATLSAIGTPGPVGITTNINVIKDDQFNNLTDDSQIVTYTVIPISAAGCKGPTRTIVLTVEPVIKAVPVNSTLNICSASAISVVLNSPSNPTPNPNALPDPLITFNYSMVSAAGITGNSSASNVAQGFTIGDVLVNNSNIAITVNYKVTAVAASAADGKGCSSSQADVFVKVEPKPIMQPTRFSQTTCEGTAIAGVTLNSSTTPSSGNGTMVFQLLSVLDATTNLAPTSVTGFTAVGTLFTPGQALNNVLSNTSATPQIIRYTFRPRFSAGLLCQGDDVSIEITVTPRPFIIVTPGVPILCSGDTFESTMTTDTDVANPGSTIVTWTALASSLDVVGESNGAGNELFQTLVNKSKTPQTVIYSITSNLNGCAGNISPITVTVNPTPSINLPPRQTVCGGAAYSIDFRTYTDTDPTLTTFEWVVSDVNGIGTPGQFDGTGTGINTTFINATNSQATLIYQITPIGPGGCRGIEKVMNLSVAPAISGAFVSVDEGICEGTPVFLTFELQGQAPFDFVYSATDVNGSVSKTITRSGNVKVEKVTPSLTTAYQIISVKDGLGCTKILGPKPKVTITVYKSVTAKWEANIPPFIGGNAAVTFTNKSTPVDGTIFRYNWSFGSDAAPSPLSAVGIGPYVVNYNRPGDHFVTLHAINVASETAGQNCESSFAARITIPILPLAAAFKFTPKAACFPQNITITENTSTGDTMDWRVIDANGRVAATSAAIRPVFLITNPGKYTITLKTSNSFTGQSAFATNQDFTVYENPVASFDLRPSIVYVPDTELTTFNFSTGAPEYRWEFGDGGSSTEIEPKYIYKVEGAYDVVLVAINDHGDGAVCSDTLTRQVTAKQGGLTKVPNAFTPNLGGPSGGQAGNNTFNDVFLPIVKGADEFSMQVFDRWGNLVFETNSSQIGWDGYDKNGKLMPAGVYVYRLTIRLSDGQRSTQIGDITMIR
jgi:gliding motility-associated-like protein